MGYRQVLVASHGTPGARAAEELALSLCAWGGSLSHLLVVPDLWQGMMGDDWLNNVSTRIAFGEYLEGELAREISEQIARLREDSSGRGLHYRHEVRQGDPTACLLGYSGTIPCDLVVIGSPRPKGIAGLRSRLKTEALVRGLDRPLMIAPYPGA